MLRTCLTLRLDKDAETYKQVVKKQIKAWLDQVNAKRSQEWMIIYVSKEPNPGSKSNSMNPKFLIKTSVYDKIKSDFNTGKRDR
jgi:hypothetical protein